MGIVSSIEQDNLGVNANTYGNVICNKNAFQQVGKRWIFQQIYVRQFAYHLEKNNKTGSPLLSLY